MWNADRERKRERDDSRSHPGKLQISLPHWSLCVLAWFEQGMERGSDGERKTDTMIRSTQNKKGLDL